MAPLRVVGLTKLFPGGGGLRPTDLAVAAGECVALLGPTGSGKSTLLRLIAGLEPATAGEVWVGGERVDRREPHRRGVSLLPQRVALYPHLTVAGNLEVANPCRPNGATEGSQGWRLPEPLAEWATAPRTPHDHSARGSAEPPPLATFGRPVGAALEPLLDRYPHQLSGGQRQLVGLAKLVAQNRPVWLLDEPFTGLDYAVREDFRRDLHLLHAEQGATIVLVTHDPADAVALGRRVGILGDGALTQLDTIERVRSRPASRFAARCLAGFSLLDGRATGDGASVRFTAVEGAVSGEAPRGSPDNLTLGFRPADLRAVPPDATPSGVVFRGWTAVSADPDGSGWLLTLVRDQLRVRALWAGGSPPPVGSRTDWQLPPEACHWFRTDTGARLGD